MGESATTCITCKPVQLPTFYRPDLRRQDPVNFIGDQENLMTLEWSTPRNEELRGWLAELTSVNFNAAAVRRRQIEEANTAYQANVAASIRSLRQWGVDQATEAEMPAATPAERARTMAQARLLAAVPEGVLEEWLRTGNTLASVLKKARAVRPHPEEEAGGLGRFPMTDNGGAAPEEAEMAEAQASRYPPSGPGTPQSARQRLPQGGPGRRGVEGRMA